MILDTRHGTGIYLDYANANCRITSNVVANTGSFIGPGPGIGGVYVEASQEPNWIDQISSGTAAGPTESYWFLLQ